MFCLNVKEWKIEQGTPIILWTCTTPHVQENEKFYYDASDNTIRVLSKPSLCLNAFGGGLNQMDQVGLWTCSAASNEQWVPGTGGQIRVKSKPSMCVNADGGLNKGTDMILYECQGGAENEQFNLQIQ